MSKAIDFKIDLRSFNKNHRRLARGFPKLFKRARSAADVQMITWMNEGSIKEPGKPPILTGALRGSATAFTGDRRVKSFGGEFSPLMNDVRGEDQSTFVYNAPYATKMHETWTPPGGPFSRQDKDVTAQWITKHLKKDKQIYVKVIASFMKSMSNRNAL